MTKRPVIYFEPTAETGQQFHCQGADGNDFTLCGFSLDGDQAAIDAVKTNPPRIDCSVCLGIIYFCRDLSGHTFKGKHK